ncbi:MAG TPA: hypothetical protein VH415_11625 [Nitrososphaeraceae archaeon]
MAAIVKDGFPQFVPTCVDSETKSIPVKTVVYGMKHRNISDDPRVTSTTTGPYNPFDMVSIKGKERTEKQG